MTQNLTTGKPVRLILLFTIPLLVGNLFQQFYNMADTFIVGRTLGVQALAAVGCTGAIMFLVVGFAVGMTSGMSIVTAQRFGAEDFQGVRRSFAAGIVLSAAVTVVLTPLSVLFVKPFLVLMQTPPEILEDAYAYIVVILGGIAACMLFNLLSNIMRAVGDSRSPLLFLVIACVLNIALDYLLILVFGMGVAGAAVATITAQVASGLLCIVYIAHRLPVLRLRRTDFRLSAADIKVHLRLGLPMGFQASIISIGSLMLQFALNGLGADAVAAFTASQKIDMLATMPLMSFGITMATYVAQNYGAGQYRRIRQGVIQCCILSISFSVLMGIVNTVFGNRFAMVFLTDNPTLVSMAHEYLTINSACYLLLGLLFILRYSLQGLGQSFIPTVAGIMELLMRSFAAVILTRFFGFTGACFASPLAWLGACIPLVIAFIVTMRHLLLRQDQEEPAGSKAASDTRELPPAEYLAPAGCQEK